jgi:hypothetical protein
MQFQSSNSFVVRTAALSSTVCGWWNIIRRWKINNQRKKDISLVEKGPLIPVCNDL